ncbi:hypothetical protein P9112_005948 [Eukaryota sp. TZLM1-RC]
MANKLRDVFFLILFVATIVVNLFISSYAFRNGDPTLLYVPLDTDALACGIDFPARPVLFFPDQLDFSHSICIEECPTTNSTTEIDGTTIHLYPTSNIFDRCLSPSMIKPFADYFGGDFLHKTLIGLRGSSSVLVESLFLTIFLSFTTLLLLNFTASFIVYILIGAVYVAAWMITIKLHNDSRDTNASNKQFYLSMAAWLGLLILTISLIICRKAIRLSITLIKQARNALKAMPSLFLAPILTWSLLVCFLVFYAVPSVAGYYSTGEFNYEDGKRSFDFSRHTQFLLGFHFFFMTWIIAYLFALTTASIAASISGWWTHNSSLPFNWIQKMGKISLFNTGSLAFGSFLVALLAIFKGIVRFIYARTRNIANRPGISIFSKILFCLVSCMEKGVKYLNRNVYILIGIGNYSFFSAAGKAMGLLCSNIRRSFTLNFILGTLLFILKIGISSFSTWMVSLRIKDEVAAGFETVLVACFLISFIIASIVFSVFSIIVETLFLSFLIEEGSAQFGILSRRNLLFKSDVVDGLGSPVAQDVTM